MRRMTGEQKPVRQSMVLCCSRKRCPEISLEPDGSFVLSDADQSAPGRVVLDREQVAELVKFLQDQLSR